MATTVEGGRLAGLAERQYTRADEEADKAEAEYYEGFTAGKFGASEAAAVDKMEGDE